MSIRIIEWQFEDGEMRLRLREPEIDDLDRYNLPNSCCLRFLDSYGDLILNAQQVLVLEQELEKVMDLERAGKVFDQAAKVLQFARQLDVDDRSHHYLKFIGD